MKQVFVVDDERSRFHAKRAVEDLPLDRAKIVTIQNETRKLSQNAQQWPILSAMAAQKQWPVDGCLTWIESEDFKAILTAAFRKETFRLAKGYDGGVVMLGSRTREFEVDEFADWLEFLNSVAAEWDIKVPLSKRRAESMGLSA